MTSAADTAEFISLCSRLDEEPKKLLFEIINGMSSGRLSGDEVEAATDRMLSGDSMLQVLEDLVQLSNQRIYEDAILDA